MDSQSGENADQSGGQNVASSGGSTNTNIGPLWNHVEKGVKQDQRGGTTKITCKFCNMIFTGTYSRIRAHLLGNKGQGVEVCNQITRSQQIECQRLEDDYEEFKKNKRINKIPLPCGRV
ncbi:hypothetical protein ACFE04_025234 [Oxalis oulophora]